MRVKIFDNTTCLEMGDFMVSFQDQDNFDISQHNGCNSTAVQSDEDNFEVLVDGNRYVLDLSNEPTVAEGQIAQLKGCEAKSDGGYQAIWSVEAIPVSDPAPEEAA